MSFSICGMIPIMTIKPTKPYLLTDTMIEAICTLVSQGLPLELCTNQLGIAENSLYRWLRYAKETEIESSQEYKLMVGIKRARSTAVLKRIKNIQKISEREDSNSWQASAWLLERSYPEHFAKRPDIQVTVNNNEPIPQAISSQSTSELESLLASLKPNDDNESYGFKVLSSGDS